VFLTTLQLEKRGNSFCLECDIYAKKKDRKSVEFLGKFSEVCSTPISHGQAVSNAKAQVGEPRNWSHIYHVVRQNFESLGTKPIGVINTSEVTQGIKDPINDQLRNIILDRNSACEMDERSHSERVQTAVKRLQNKLGDRLYNPMHQLECEHLSVFDIESIFYI
jgi:hypothetical protein